MKKRIKLIVLTLIIMGGLTAGAIYLLTNTENPEDEFQKRISSEQSDQLEERLYKYDTDRNAIELLMEGDNKNVLNFGSKDVYNVKTSDDARARLDRLIKRIKATFEAPIIAANPFGTNDNTFYFYFETNYEGMIRYTVTVPDETIPDHVRYVNNGKEENLTNVHEFVVGGLVPGMTNYIQIEVLDSTGAKREAKTYKYEAPDAKVENHISFEKGNSKETITNGLYFVFASDSKKILAYDNSGILRNVTNTETAHGKRFYQVSDGVIYQVSPTKVAKVSSLGRVTGTAEVKGYDAIRDFSYDGYDNIYAIVKKGKQDRLVSVSFSTGKIREVYKFAKGITIQSLTTPQAGSMYVSATAPMGLVRMDALTGQMPKISFVLGKKDDWKKVGVKKKLVIEEETAVQWKMTESVLNLVDYESDGNYDSICTYLFDKQGGTAIQFTVDGKKGTVTEENNFPTNKEGKSLSQCYSEHFLIAELEEGLFGEYDRSGRLTKQFTYPEKVDGVVKASLNQLCFLGGE